MKKFCFYHSDLDGECSAAIIRKVNNGDIECIPVNYNTDFPFYLISKNDQVWIVDYSLQKDEWDRLLFLTKNIIWIDHHKTAIDASVIYGIESLLGLRDIEKSGCVLTWEYCFFGKEPPKVVKLVGDHDIWRFEFGDETREFNSGIFNTVDTRPESAFWDEVLISKDFINMDASHYDAADHIIRDICEIGKKILAKQFIKDSQMLMSWGFEVYFENYHCIAINRGSIGPSFFKSIGSNYDILIPFVFDGEKYTVSLYQSRADIDLGAIAKKYGGGGHKGAAGFQCKELPFQFIRRLSQ